MDYRSSARPARGLALLAAPLLLALAAGPARAQTCPSPVAITCGQTLAGDSSDGQNLIASYSCLTSEPGREANHRLVLTECVRLNAQLRPASFDGTLAVLPVVGGDCAPGACLAGADSGYSGAPESLAVDLPPGEYILSVDGYYSWDYGPYELELACTTYPACADGDGDGHPGLDAATCPCGDDCDDADPAIHPGADEICDNGVDDDCGGGDAACPACGAVTAWACGASGTASLLDGTDTVEDYCGTAAGDWYDEEYIASIELTRDTTVLVEVTSDSDVDLFVVESFGRDDVCDPSACAGYAVGSAEPTVAFFAHADQTYFISVEYWTGGYDLFDYTLACLNETCQAGAALACGAAVTGDTTGGTNSLSAYPDIAWGARGPEVVYSLSSLEPTRVTLSLDIDPDGWNPAPDLGLYVVEENLDGLCVSGGLVAFSDRVQDDTQNPAEVVSFTTTPGRMYYVLVDSWRPEVVGSYTLSSSCEIDCPDGEEECSGACVDTQGDLENCGGCGQGCVTPHATPACVAGDCVIQACDAGQADCAGGAADGCETPLGTDADCAGCGDACAALPHAGGSSCDPAGPACLVVCDPGFGDCSAEAGCETDTLSDEGHCGDCLTTCDAGAGEFCWQSGCITDCPDGLTRCDDACIDTSADPLNCGGCGQPCQAPAHTQMGCVDSGCVILGCEPGWEDCAGGPADGCETPLGTPGDCAGCGDDCTGDYPHAVGGCQAGVCVLASCLEGFGDCAGGPADGCETELGGDANCAACGDDCRAVFPNGTGACMAGACTLATCAAGFEDCNEQEADGCETPLGTATDCLGCADACTFAHGEGACAAGGCSLERCLAGWDDCNLAPADGFEADLSSEATCGACERACAGTESCRAGQCESNCRDADGDGYQAANCGGDDCNDYDGLDHPGAAERCTDGRDNDCDGTVDEGCAGCADADGDGAQAQACGGTDCDDADAAIHPGAAETCGDGVDQDCSGADQACGCADADGDGHQDAACGGDDCNDGNPAAHPGAAETCGDGVDQDCSGGDEPCACDADSDGHQALACGGDDCDDQAAGVHPGALESCGDGLDQDCDGQDRPCPGGGGGCACGTQGGPEAPALLGLGLGLGALCFARRRRGD
ncbi:MAG TPA: putative metal-binding motif-containing protein [Myxococcota bacterium]|nr:putative metal-binding motif-containing protein [Myxococcota bacterium]HRY92952.1 putative metal-binding motif-containing protein [Myxococcota bacterium]HSA21255.1 putative metal-binding motif-containing protein [Myxococcota bacterium]